MSPKEPTDPLNGWRNAIQELDTESNLNSLLQASREALKMLKELEHTRENITPLGKQTIDKLEKALEEYLNG